MNKERIRNLCNWLCQIYNQISFAVVSDKDRVRVWNDLIAISYDIGKVYPYIGSELFRLKDNLFNAMGQVNPVIMGEIIALLRYLCNEQNNDNNIWNMVHPRIISVSKELFENGHYANAAEDAFIEINSRVKRIYAVVRPNTKVPDGDTAMTAVFSLNDPIVRLSDINTETGKNIQKGYMQMFAGGMSALRNPKAHENIPLDKDEAKRRLLFASMLMYKLDEGVEITGIKEE
jgi:uncharacterized protein (TIGR02391 family)